MTDQKHDCKFCGYVGPLTSILRESGVHYAEWRCPECNRHHGFIPKPETDATKYRRPASHRGLVGKYSRGFCEMCLTKESDLAKGRTLEAHHVDEFRNDGSPERENIWIVCTACHRLITHTRTYYGIVESVAASLTAWRDDE